MENPAEAVIRRTSNWKIPSSPYSTPNKSICTSALKQVLLQDWWLIKTDSDSHGRRLGIGGFASKGKQGIRIFHSSPIVKRLDAVTLTTVDGITILIDGQLNRSRTLGNGFSGEVCHHFMIGFPYYWEEFTALSNFSACEGIFGSDRTPREQSMNIFDDILQQNNILCGEGGCSANSESCPQIITMVATPDETFSESMKMKVVQDTRDTYNLGTVVHCGPLTRSRSRLRKTYR